MPTEENMQQVADSMPEGQWEQIRAHVQSLPPDEREQWFAEFTASHMADRIDAQDAMTRADSLRVEQPGMGGEAGGFQVAASPLAHIGAGMQNYQAQKQYKQGETDLAAANQGMADQLGAGAKAVIGNPLPPAGGMPGGMPGGGRPGGGMPGGGMAGAIRSMAGGGPAGRGAAPGGGGGMTPEMLMMLRNR